MKKQLLFALFTFITLRMSVFAQLPGEIADLDTLSGRVGRYYYSDWYDQCDLYRTDSNCFTLNTYSGSLNYDGASSNHYILAKEQRIPTRMMVKGVVALVAIDPTTDYNVSMHMPPVTNTRAEEYLYIFQADTAISGYPCPDYPPHMTLVNSIRWDTLTPHVLKLPQKSRTDNQDFLYCYAYEGYFQTPMILDTVFYIMGTYRSNWCDSMNTYFSGRYHYYPTVYTAVTDGNAGECLHCPKGLNIYSGIDPNVVDILGYSYDDFMHTLMNNDFDRMTTGPFLPIVDWFELTVQPSNVNWGTVSGGGRYPEMSTAIVTATAAPGYIFTQWSDGVTDSTRSIEMTRDLTLTAVFVAIE